MLLILSHIKLAVAQTVGNYVFSSLIVCHVLRLFIIGWLIILHKAFWRINFVDKKLVVTSATLAVTGALLVVTMFASSNKCHGVPLYLVSCKAVAEIDGRVGQGPARSPPANELTGYLPSSFLLLIAMPLLLVASCYY